MSLMISQRLCIDDVYKKAESILIYASYRTEVDTSYIVNKALEDGKRVAFPKSVFVNDVPTLAFYEINNINQLNKGFKDIYEPDIDKYSLKKITDISDLCIVPGAVFDKTGNRIGYGKGFYDRFLSLGMVKKSVGLAYEFQIANDIPVEDTDMRLDMIFTEENLYVCK